MSVKKFSRSLNKFSGKGMFIAKEIFEQIEDFNVTSAEVECYLEELVKSSPNKLKLSVKLRCPFCEKCNDILPDEFINYNHYTCPNCDYSYSDQAALLSFQERYYTIVSKF